MINENYEILLFAKFGTKIDTMADYHDLYLNGGVLLLHFIIETFREESINSF